MLPDVSQAGNHRSRITWILVADVNRVRILELVDPNQSLSEVDIDQEVDALAATAPAQPTRPEETDIVKRIAAFRRGRQDLAEIAITIGTCLERARQSGRFDRLVVAAPKETLSLLERSLTPDVHDRLILKLESNLMGADNAVIRACLPL